MLWDTLLLLVTFHLGWILGKAYQKFIIRETLTRLAKQGNVSVNELIEDEDETNKDINIILLQSEEVGSTILIYDVLTNEFICQGNTLEEAAQRFNERKQNVIGAIVYNNNELVFKDGKVSTVNELKT